MQIDKSVGSHGQALLVTVLVMVVVLTIGLAVVSRSIIQVKTAADEANSEKAFSAAEAGIDQVLKTGTGVSNQSLDSSNSTKISTVTITNVTNAKILLNNATQVSQDDGSDVWLSTYPTYTNPFTGSLRIYWGSASSACSDAALEISVISGASPYTISRYAYDPCPARASGNHFTTVANGSGGTISANGTSATYNYSVSITISNGLLARITPLYTDTIVGIAGYTDATQTTAMALPSQGQLITSTGTSGSTQRKITYFQGYDSVPSELFYSLFSAQ